MTPTNPIAPFTPFLPAIYDLPEEGERFKSTMSENLSLFADTINDKKIGSYTSGVSDQNGEKWIYKITKKVRNGFQAISFIPSLPNAGVLVLTRSTDPQYPIDNIDPNFVITLSYGTASKPCSSVGAGDGDYFTYMNRGDPRIIWNMSDTTITITSFVDLSAYSGFIVVHFLRAGT